MGVFVRTLNTLILLAFVASSTACGPRSVVIDGREMTVEEGATHVFEEGQRAAAQGDTVTAKAKYRDVIDRFASAARAGDALAALGDIMMSERGCTGAVPYYQKLVDDFDTHPDRAKAKSALDACGVATEERSEPSNEADARYAALATDAERKEMASAAADAAIAASEWSNAVRWLMRVRAVEPEGAQQQAVEAEIVEIIDSRVAFADVRRLLDVYSSDDFPADALTYKLGRIQHHVRDFTNAKETLDGFVARWPQSKFVDGAKALLRIIDGRTRVEPKTVGVLVPLSGKFKGYGKNVVQAVRLAAGEFESKDGKTPINVVVRDSKGSALEAAAAVEQFVLDDGAVAVVGGLFRVEAEPAATKAQELGIPFLTLSQADAITDIGPFIFRSGLTPASEAKALVSYAMDVLGMESFAILHPRHPYGEKLANLFWDEVAARNGEIRGIETYAATDTTFTWPVKRLVGRARVDLRYDYKKAIRECGKKGDPYRRERCKRKVRTDLPPLVDFDGLFIPDYPRTLALIAPALAFEDIIVETDKRRLKKIEKTLGRKVKPVRLMGASGWNSPALPEKAERYVENALFTDGFYSGGDDKATAAFVTEFRKQFQRTPGLPEGLFFDAIKIVRQIIEAQAPQNRNTMREALRRVHDFPGVTGKTSFRAGQDATKDVRVLTIKNSQIVEVPPPAEEAPAPAP